MCKFDLIVMTIAARITEVHELVPTINRCNVPFTNTTDGLLDFVFMLVSDYIGNLVFDFILRVLIE